MNNDILKLNSGEKIKIQIRSMCNRQNGESTSFGIYLSAPGGSSGIYNPSGGAGEYGGDGSGWDVNSDAILSQVAEVTMESKLLVGL